MAEIIKSTKGEEGINEIQGGSFLDELENNVTDNYELKRDKIRKKVRSYIEKHFKIGFSDEVEYIKNEIRKKVNGGQWTEENGKKVVYLSKEYGYSNYKIVDYRDYYYDYKSTEDKELVEIAQDYASLPERERRALNSLIADNRFTDKCIRYPIQCSGEKKKHISLCFANLFLLLLYIFFPFMLLHPLITHYNLFKMTHKFKYSFKLDEVMRQNLKKFRNELNTNGIELVSYKCQYHAEEINVEFSTFDEECLVSKKETSYEIDDPKKDFSGEKIRTTMLFKVVF